MAGTWQIALVHVGMNCVLALGNGSRLRWHRAGILLRAQAQFISTWTSYLVNKICLDYFDTTMIHLVSFRQNNKNAIRMRAAMPLAILTFWNSRKRLSYYSCAHNLILLSHFRFVRILQILCISKKKR